MTDYIVVTASTSHELARQVNDLITRGYQPLGGIAAVPKAPEAGVRQSVDYLQAMLKKGK